jgi:hypothetical protein
MTGRPLTDLQRAALAALARPEVRETGMAVRALADHLDSPVDRSRVWTYDRTHSTTRGLEKRLLVCRLGSRPFRFRPTDAGLEALAVDA